MVLTLADIKKYKGIEIGPIGHGQPRTVTLTDHYINKLGNEQSSVAGYLPKDAINHIEELHKRGYINRDKHNELAKKIEEAVKSNKRYLLTE